MDPIFTAPQKELSEKVISLYEKTNHVTLFLHGKMGTGKTMFSYILAKEMNATICDTFTPYLPGSYIEDVYSRVSPSKNKPFNLLLDEIDILLDKIHHNSIQRHKNIPIQLYDKASWNHFLDAFDRNIYPNMIVVLCSNKSYEDIEKNLDPCYLRNGRINIIHHLSRLN